MGPMGPSNQLMLQGGKLIADDGTLLSQGVVSGSVVYVLHLPSHRKA